MSRLNNRHHDNNKWQIGASLPSRLRLILALLSLAILAFVGKDHLASLKAIEDSSWRGIIGISILFLLSHLGVAMLWNGSLRAQGHLIGIANNFLLTFLRAYWNLVIPWAGAGTVGVYLKKRSRLPYTTYLHVQWELSWLGTAVIAALGAFFLLDLSRADEKYLGWAALMTVLAIISVLMIRAPRLARLTNVTPTWISTWLNERAGPRAKPLPLIKLILLSLTIFLLRTMRTWAVFVAVGLPLSLNDAVLITVIAELSVFLNITPNGLGIREGAISLLAAILGHDPGIGLAAAVLDRLIFTFWIIALGQWAIWNLNWRKVQPG